MGIGPVVGVDVSKRFSDMCILAPDNSVFRRVKIYHDLTSMQRSLSALQDAEKEFGTKPVIVMESTAHYHRLLWKFMSDAGYNVIVINPIQSGGLKNINVRKIKNDKVDAYKIAALYRLKNLRPSNMPVQAIGGLRALSRQHHDIKQDITRYTNRLTALLDQAFPGYDAIFSRNTGKSSLDVLERFPTPHDILEAKDGELYSVLLIRKRGKVFATSKADKLVGTARTALGLGIQRNADSILIRSCVATIRLMQGNVDTIDNEMRKIITENPEIETNLCLLQTIPGIGEYGAIVLLSEIGDFSSFSKPKQLAAFFGLDPSERQSGKFKGTKNKISKRGSRYVRCVLNMAAHNSIHPTRQGRVGNPVLASYFEKKRLSKPHKVAICAVMHKIVNIIFAVLRDQKPFELRLPEDHDRALKERNKLLAA